MILKIKHFVVFTTLILFTSCKTEPNTLSEVKGKQIKIDSSLVTVDSIEAYVKPYRKRINEILDSTLAYAPKTLTKEEGIYNTSAGNLMADIVFQAANPIFKSRTSNEIDFVLLNHGGIRSIISKGNVTARTAYEVMPFENSIVVVELSGKSVLELLNFLKNSGRAHPISGMQLILSTNNEIASIKIQGKSLNTEQTYYVATNNYLVTGGDDMVFFKDAKNPINTDYLIRNAMIDYFKKVDTVFAEIDNRFYKMN